MKLNYDRKSNDPTYFIQIGIRNGKKVTTKNVVRIGKHSELLKITDDPLSYAKQQVKEYNEKMKSEKVDVNISIDLDQKIINQGDVSSKSLCKNIGYFVIKKIYDDLELDGFFSSIKEERKFKFDPSLIDLALVSFRILDPGSKLYTCNNISKLYGNFDFSYHDVLRFMDVLEEHYDEYLTHLFNASNNVIKRNTSVCYFDCTNFYFEKETEDEDIIDEVTGEVIKGLLKYGVSKEHRPNPIVQMGLFMDADGIPLSMCINSGSSNESLCAVPAEKKLLSMFKDKDIIYCSDAGLGYMNTRVFNDMNGRKFVVTQSVKKLKDVIQQAVFNDFEYKFIEDDSKASLEFMKSFDVKLPENRKYYDTYIYKTIEVDNAVDLGLSELVQMKNGKYKKKKSTATLKQRLIITYSRKMAEYQKNVRARQVERAKALLDGIDPETYKNSPNDIRRFIKTKKVSKKTDYYLDEDKIHDEAQYDGYYAIATNIFDMSVKEIISIQSQRYKIEDCFRVMKTNFNGRPVYHYLRERIKAHFLICYTALLIYRLLETKFDRNGTHFTDDQIIETLQNMNVLNFEDLYYRACYTGSNVLDALEQIYGLGLNKKNYLPKSLNKYLKKI